MSWRVKSQISASWLGLMDVLGSWAHYHKEETYAGLGSWTDQTKDGSVSVQRPLGSYTH